jgi:hypothetical protein
MAATDALLSVAAIFSRLISAVPKTRGCRVQTAAKVPEFRNQVK